MAPLTWRNVDAPNFSGANSALALVGTALNNAQDSALKGIADYKANEVTANSNAAQLAAMKYQDPAAYAAALANGTVLPAGTNPALLNKDSLDFLNTHAATLLDNRQKVATTGLTNSNTNQNNVQTAGMVTANQKSAYDFGQEQQNNAAKLQAAPILTDIQTDLASGDPNKIASAKSRLNANAGLFQQAGIDASSLVKGAVGETVAGIKSNNELTTATRSAADTKDTNTGIDIGRKATQNFATQTEAEASIRSNPDISAVTKSAALDQIAKDAPSVYSTGPTTIEQDISRLGTRPGELAPPPGGPVSVTNKAGLVQPSPDNNGGSTNPLYTSLEQTHGLPTGYLSKTAQIESGGKNLGPNQANAIGVFQFVPSTAKQMGVNPTDPTSSADGAARLAVQNAQQLRTSLGRDPTGGEIYLAHQQGAGGAAKLLANPNALAANIVGTKAVIQNGGTQGMTAGEFANLWINKYNGVKGTGSISGAVADSNIANATAPGAPQPTNIPLPNGQTMNQDTIIPNASNMLKAATTPLTTPLPTPIVNGPAPVNQVKPTVSLAPAPASAAISQTVAGNQPLDQTNAAAAQQAAQATPVTPTPSPAGVTPRSALLARGTAPAPAVAATIASAVAKGINPVVTQAGNAPIADQLQTLANTSTVDKSFNSNSPLIAAIAAVPDQNESKPATVARILQEGQMKDVPPEAVTDAIQHVIDKTNLTPAAAGEFVKNAFYSKDLATRIFGVKIPFLTWDQYGYAGANSSRGARIDEDAISKTLKSYFPERKDGTFDASSMIGAIQQKQQQNLGDATLQNILAIASKAQALHDTQMQDTTGKVNKDAVNLNYGLQIEQLRQKAAAIGGSKIFENNLKSISAK